MLSSSSNRTMVLIGVMLSRVAAKKFLQFEPLSREDVDRSVASELAGNISKDRLDAIENSLQAVYTALPKNTNDRLEHQAVRYVLHRFFVQQHGWYIRGLEPNGDTWSILSSTAPPKEWIASYIQDRFEERTGTKGTDLTDLTALAATIEDLVRKEASKELEEVYRVLDLPITGSISREQAEEALKTYMMIYLLNRNVSIDSRSEAEIKLQRFTNRYTGWSEARAFLQDVEQHHSGLASREGVDFATTASVVAEIGEHFGSFNDGECKDLKGTLQLMERGSGKVGRIRLHDFYNKSLYSHWKFTEKVEYLRELGALDESKPNQPLVILPNYLSAFSNCLKATSIYAVCCRNECEDLMGHLEREIAAPTAGPERIAELVAALPSGTVPAPRRLPAKLLGRLSQLAEANGGEVHLHGRLFAQWMHHAFPRECPFPHEAGTTNPQTASEWMKKSGSTAHASEEEMRKIVEDACLADAPHGEVGEAHRDSEEEPELPWSDAEELLVAARPRSAGARRASWLLSPLLMLMAGLAVERLAPTVERKRKLRMVLAFVCLVALLCAADLVDMALFLPLSLALVLLGALRHASMRLEPAAVKLEKCCV